MKQKAYEIAAQAVAEPPEDMRFPALLNPVESTPIFGGEKVSPSAVLLTGAPDDPDTLRRIRVHCRSRLARHMVPVRIDFVAGSLSTPRHKIQRTLRN